MFVDLMIGTYTSRLHALDKDDNSLSDEVRTCEALVNLNMHEIKLSCVDQYSVHFYYTNFFTVFLRSLLCADFFSDGCV